MRKKKIIIILSLVFVVIIIGEFQKSRIIVSSWRGIVPGETKEEDISGLLGDPEEIIYCQENRVALIGNLEISCEPEEHILIYRENNSYEAKTYELLHMVRIRNNEVWAIFEDGIPILTLDTLSEKITEYGKPNDVVWSRRNPFLRGWLYCQQGLIIESLDYMVTWSIYIEPERENNCWKLFEDLYSQEIPFQISDTSDIRPDYGFLDRLNLTKPDNMPTFIKRVWPKPGVEIGLRVYKTNLLWNHYEKGVGVQFESVQSKTDLKLKVNDYEWLRQNIRLSIDGDLISNNIIYFSQPEETLLLAWPIELPSGKHDVNLVVMDINGKNFEFSWYFTIN